MKSTINFVLNRFVFFYLVVHGYSSTAFSLNQIDAKVDPRIRCMSEGVSQGKCEKMRSQALEIGCITKDEYETLKDYGSFPTCNLLRGDGLEMLDGWCSCGCFHPDVRLKIKTKDVGGYEELEVKNLFENIDGKSLVHLSRDASLKNMTLSTSSIRLQTKGKEKEPVVHLWTADDRLLILTGLHPVLTSKGMMKLAKDIKLQDELVDFSGDPVEIVHIARRKFDGDVYNFSTEGETLNEHVIFANHIAVGDQYWQASLEDQMNRIFIRK